MDEARIPKLPKIPFIAGDVILVILAIIIRTTSVDSPLIWFWVIFCVALGGCLTCLPFYVEFKNRMRLAEYDASQSNVENAERIEAALEGIGAVSQNTTAQADRTEQAARDLEGVLNRFDARLENFDAPGTGSPESGTELRDSLAAITLQLETFSEALAKDLEAAQRSSQADLTQAMEKLTAFTEEQISANIASELTSLNQRIDALVATIASMPTQAPGNVEVVDLSVEEALDESPEVETEIAEEESEILEEEAELEDAEYQEAVAEEFPVGEYTEDETPAPEEATIAEEVAAEEEPVDEATPEVVEDEPAPEEETDVIDEEGLDEIIDTIDEATEADEESAEEETLEDEDLEDDGEVSFLSEEDEAELENEEYEEAAAEEVPAGEYIEDLTSEDTPDAPQEDTLEVVASEEAEEAPEETIEEEPVEEEAPKVEFVKAGPEQVDEFDMGILDAEPEAQEDDGSHDQPNLLDDLPEGAEKAKKAGRKETSLIAQVLIGIGNKPYVRGTGPGLSMEKGVPMDFLEIGKWQWVAPESTEPVTVTIYKNDQVPADGEPIEIEPGQKRVVTPRFV